MTQPGLLQSPSRFLNRELSWLAFDQRVLDEANRPENPLLERVRFLSIAASNLDEFYMVRVAGLRNQVVAGYDEPGPDGWSPAQQLIAIQAAVVPFMRAQQDTWTRLRGELKAAGIEVVGLDALSAEERAFLDREVHRDLFPLLTPLAVDPTHPFPFIRNLGLGLALHLREPRSGNRVLAVTLVPDRTDRFVRLPGPGPRFVLVEDVILSWHDQLFPGFEVLSHGTFRVLRNSELEWDPRGPDVMEQFEAALKDRRFGDVIRLAVTASMTAELRELLLEGLEAKVEDVFDMDGLVGVATTKELVISDRPDLLFPPFEVRYPARIKQFGGDCFAAMRSKDLVVHHPYESFDVVVQFLKQAAADPAVVAIKQTLYRTSRKSPIVEALLDAANAGKSVLAMVEVKARFDEEANLRWARELEEAGAHVLFGFAHLKTHAKMSLVARREPDGTRLYGHFGTGNYHPINARIYTDLSLFTCDPELCADANLIFNYMASAAPPRSLRQVRIAPHDMRQTVVSCIEREIAHARAGRPATIWAKMNALVDPDVIDAMYRASAAGVQIDLVVRGICCLRPGVPGLSENIRVRSLVGRFLEHSRIACFGNGHPLPSPQAEVWISSADWMTRNMDVRLEAMVPIRNETVKQQVMGQIMGANLKDEANSWVLLPDGRYQRVQGGADAFSAHRWFMANPSLSGRGHSG